MDEQQHEVDMDQVYDDVLRLADEFNSKLTSFTALISGSFILWVLVLMAAAAASGIDMLLATILVPVLPLYILAPRRHSLTGENIALHCTETAFCGAVCSSRPLCLSLLVQKEGALWRQILDVTSSAKRGTAEGRRIYALNRLLIESIRQSALDTK